MRSATQRRTSSGSWCVWMWRSAIPANSLSVTHGRLICPLTIFYPPCMRMLWSRYFGGINPQFLISKNNDGNDAVVPIVVVWFFVLSCRISGNAASDRNIHSSVSEQLKKNFAKSRWKVKKENREHVFYIFTFIVMNIIYFHSNHPHIYYSCFFYYHQFNLIKNKKLYIDPVLFYQQSPFFPPFLFEWACQGLFRHASLWLNSPHGKLTH